MDGVISWSEFYRAGGAFMERWNRLNSSLPPWSWVSSSSSSKQHLNLGVASSQSHHQNQMNGYLVQEKLCLPVHNSTTQRDGTFQEDLDMEEEITFTEEEEPVDSATLVESNNGVGVHYYDFHIVYSASYRVPVLYFRAYCIDGQPLKLEEIEKDLPSSSSKVLVESKWTFITQEEHPYLNRPWYKLHPCGTSEWMKLLFQSDTCVAKHGLSIELYLFSWLSVVGQVFGLRIPPELFNHQHQL
ncbi:ubiquitin-like-conjugating enzyme ATG10 [Cannabis sativa]|uniref:ubiquitin-like-conjugating enzyme ATG10 n=1 Tax=Cannabis sativa TaxID=3483 RepID=UPI0029CA6C5A|nr:ubiquitin-like-conjugating enzyme ATG10 [Cannabis sativa]